MYIAFRWLFGLTLAAWLFVCCLDLLKKTNKCLGPRNVSHLDENDIYKKQFAPKTPRFNKYLKHRAAWLTYQQSEANLLHYIMFAAGAFIMALHHRRSDLIVFAKKSIFKIGYKINVVYYCYIKQLKIILKVTAIKMYMAVREMTNILWETLLPILNSGKKQILKIFYTVFIILINTIQKLKEMVCLEVEKSSIDKTTQDDFALVNKLHEIEKLKCDLEQVLLSNAQENKKLRNQILIETMAKNRILKQIYETKINLKESKTEFLSIQKLYLITCQENDFLKSRIKQLETQKQNADRKFTSLVYKIYQTKNIQLMEYCTKIINYVDDIVSTVNVLRKSRSYSNYSNVQRKDNATLTELKAEASTACAPKSKGFPGEFTAPNNDCVLENIYECNYNLDNGECVEQIREFSMYAENDYFLHYSSSRTIVTQLKSPDSESEVNSIISLNQRFLSSSPIFIKFLESNKDTGLITPCPPLLYSAPNAARA